MHPTFHRLSLFTHQANIQGRADLAAKNAAVCGRIKLAMLFARRAWPQITAREAYKYAVSEYRAATNDASAL